jgi:hypothetical protein
LAEVFCKLDYVPDFDCMVTGKNAICKKFYSKIPQVGTCGVKFLCQELLPTVSYFCGPPVKPGVNCLLILPVWVSTVFWVALQQNENFQKAIVKEQIFFHSKSSQINPLTMEQFILDFENIKK